MLKWTVWTLLSLAGLAAAAFGAWIFVMSRVEQPKYAVVLADGPIEVRDYPALTVAEVAKAGGRWPAVNAGFRPLAGYIFAKERPGPTIAMTAPVTQTPATGETWEIRFIMPSGSTVESLPQPASGEIRLRTIPAGRKAAIRFSGVATDESIAAEEARLRNWLAQRGTPPSSPPTYAYYNDPWTPGPLRRNEVLFDLPAKD